MTMDDNEKIEEELNSGHNGMREFITMTIGDQMLGIPVLLVHDVLGPQNLTKIPLAPESIAGALNLRGRIVTAIDVRKRLGLPPLEEGEKGMSVVVEHNGEPYSFVIDAVGEVLNLADEDFEKNPATLDPRWSSVSQGIYRLEDRLLLVLAIDHLLDLHNRKAA